MLLYRRTFLTGSLSAFAFALDKAGAQTPTRDEGFFQLEARSNEAFLRGADAGATQTLGYAGASARPVLRIRKGEELKLRLVNKLQQPTSVHFRGLRGPNGLDGVAPLTQKPVAPGESYELRTIPPDAGTFCFHPHAFPFAAEQAARGLGGILIVDEEKPTPVDHDFIVAFADWLLDAEGGLGPAAILTDDSAGAGRLGPLLTINGAPAPWRQDVRPGARLRLRLVNVAAAQITALTFEGVTPYIGAIDSQPCDLFDPVNRTIPIAPGARFDIFFDMPDAQGAQVNIALRRWPVPPVTMALKRWPDAGKSYDRPAAFASFNAKGARCEKLPPLSRIADNPALPPIIPLQNAKRFDLSIARMDFAKSPKRAPDPRRLWGFNGLAKRPDDPKPLFSVKRGTPISLGFVNTSDIAHVMRIHGHVMRQLHLLDDGWEPYWRDSVIVAAGRTVRVAFLADNPGKWLIGSGILAHAESGLSAWFEVV